MASSPNSWAEVANPPLGIDDRLERKWGDRAVVLDVLKARLSPRRIGKLTPLGPTAYEHQTRFQTHPVLVVTTCAMPKVRVGSIELCYESQGEGPVVLLIMGLGAQLVFWPEDFCRGLVERGFRVVRFDNRDAGESSRLDDLPVPRLGTQVARWMCGRPIAAPYTLDDMADDAAGLLAALGIEHAHVVGASLGGMVAQLVALRHPDRVASLTSIMSHPGDRLSNIPWPGALRALFRPVARGRAQAQDAWVKFFRAVGSRGFRFDEAGLRERAGLHFDRGPSPHGFARQFSAVLAASDRREALRSLRIPALVIHGNADPLVPKRGGIETARALPLARLLMIEGMGHDLPRGAWPMMFDAIEELATSPRA